MEADKMEKERNIPLKNYIILGVVLILSVIVVIYFYMWNNAYEESKLNTTIMDKYLQVINYNELNNYLIENKDAVIYISVLEDQKIRNFERKFKSIIVNNSLNSDILYLDLTSELKNNNTKKEIDKTIKDKNYNVNYTIKYGQNYFPKKQYKGITYNEGYYESLVITLGNGKGDNWWCVLFPPLCLLDNENQDEVEYKFLVKELLDKIF